MGAGGGAIQYRCAAIGARGGVFQAATGHQYLLLQDPSPVAAARLQLVPEHSGSLQTISLELQLKIFLRHPAQLVLQVQRGYGVEYIGQGLIVGIRECSLVHRLRLAAA